MSTDGCPPDSGAQINLEGAAGGALLGTLFAGPKGAVIGGTIGALSGQDEVTVINNIMNTVVAEAFVESQTITSFAGTTNQSIVLEVPPSQSDDTGNIGCAACIQMRNDVINSQTELLQTALDTYGVDLVNKEQISESTSNEWNENPVADCTVVCKSVAVQNVSQTSYANINVRTQAYDTIANEMKAVINAKMKSQFDAAASVGLGLLGGTIGAGVGLFGGLFSRALGSVSWGSLLSGPDSTCVVNDLSNQMINRIDQTFVETLVGRASVFQLVEVQGNSIWLSNVEQSVQLTSITNLISELGTFNIQEFYGNLQSGITVEETDETANFLRNILEGFRTTTEIFSNAFGAVAITILLIGCVILIWRMSRYLLGDGEAQKIADALGKRTGSTKSSSKIQKGVWTSFIVLFWLAVAVFLIAAFVPSMPSWMLWVELTLTAGFIITGIWYTILVFR